MLRQRAARRHERGQALLLALALIGSFALVVAAALHMASTGAAARAQSAVLAGSDALAEGASTLAQANESRFDIAPCPVAPALQKGVAVFDSGGVHDTVSYTLPSCTEQFLGSGAGRRCGLCLLNPSATLGAALNTKRFLAVAGEIDIAGGACTTCLGASGSVCSAASSPPPTSFATCDKGGIIRYFNAAAKPDNGSYVNWRPAPQLSTGPLTDPLSSLGTPSTSGDNGNLTLHANGTWAPGVYDSVSIKNASATMSGGVYVVLKSLTIDNNANLTMANGSATAMIYFGPSATLSFGTNSQLQVKGLGKSDPSYPNIGLYFDRANTTTVDNSGNSAILNVSGTIYGAGTTFNFGDAQPSVLPFRLIAFAVAFSGNPGGSGLNIDAGGFPSLCSQYQATGSTAIAGTDPDVPSNMHGVVPYGNSHAQFQECRGGLSTTSQMSQFNYVP